MIVHLILFTENTIFSDTHKSVKKFSLKSKSVKAIVDYSTVQATEMSKSKTICNVERNISDRRS